MKRRSERWRVLILGGGFAGLATALELRPDRNDVTLVDGSRWFEFLPNIRGLLSGVKTPELLSLPLDRNIRRAGHTFVRDTVTAIDPVARTVATKRRPAIGYDALIVALGGVDATRGVPGVVEHAFSFKSVEQCKRIGKRLARLAARRKAARVVVIGGGLEGVEALGEILRRHRGSDLHVALVEARERLLPEAPATLDAHVRDLCAPYEVDFEMEAPVQTIEPKAVVLGDLTCFLVIGKRALAGPSLGANKRAVFELLMGQLDAQPLWTRLPRVVQRADRAARELIWPTVSSLEALRRQGHISLL